MAKKKSKRPLTKAQRERRIQKARYQYYEREQLRARDFAHGIIQLSLAAWAADAIRAERELLEKNEHHYRANLKTDFDRECLASYEDDLDVLERGVAWARLEGVSTLADWVRKDGEAFLFEFPDRLVDAFGLGSRDLLDRLENVKERARHGQL